MRMRTAPAPPASATCRRRRELLLREEPNLNLPERALSETEPKNRVARVGGSMIDIDDA